MAGLFARPRPESVYRRAWNLGHFGVGWITIALAIANIYIGLIHEAGAALKYVIVYSVVGPLYVPTQSVVALRLAHTSATPLSFLSQQVTRIFAQMLFELVLLHYVGSCFPAVPQGRSIFTWPVLDQFLARSCPFIRHSHTGIAAFEEHVKPSFAGCRTRGQASPTRAHCRQQRKVWCFKCRTGTRTAGPAVERIYCRSAGVRHGRWRAEGRHNLSCADGWMEDCWVGRAWREQSA